MVTEVRTFDGGYRLGLRGEMVGLKLVPDRRNAGMLAPIVVVVLKNLISTC